MSLTLNRYANGDTNYVSKLNSDVAAIEGAVGGLQGQMTGAASAGSTAGNGFEALFGTDPAVIGSGSYACADAGSSNLSVAAGYAWKPSIKAVVSKAGVTTISFAGQGADTYYVIPDAAGTPAIYTSDDGDALYSVVWTGAAFGDITLLATTQLSFLSLADAPASYTGAANKLVAVKADESGIEFIAATAPDAFVGLSDVPASYSGQGGKLVQVNGGETGLEFGDPSPTAFAGLSDVPADYTGDGEKYVKVKATEDGLEFVADVPVDGAANFIELADCPATYSGQANKIVKVKGSEDGLEFGTAPVAAFPDLSDSPPGGYAGQALRVLMCNGAEDGLEWTDAAAPSTFLGLSDAPGSYASTAGKLVAVKGAEDGLEFVAAPDPGASAFTDLSDVPANYSGAGGKVVQVTSGADGLEFSSQPFLIPIFLSGKPGASALLLDFIPAAAVSFPASLTGSTVRVGTNPTSTATYSFTKNGSEFGTLAIATDGTPTWTSAAGASFNGTTDYLRVIAPTSQDATLSDVGMCLKGTR